MDFDSIANLKARIEKDLHINDVDIPEDINISTMTMEAKFDTNFFTWNIYRYINRDPQSIINVTIRNTVKKCRIKQIHPTSVFKAKRKAYINKKKYEFLNQVTAIVAVSKKRNNMPVSVKIFRNGTLHFTGCHNIDNVLEVAHKLCIECAKVRAVIAGKKIREITFVENIDALKLDRLHSFKIDMINSNFVVPFEIDRPKLYHTLKRDNFNVYYDSNKHAAVNITYKKGLTLFVFESGSIIIIVGNDGFAPILDGYNFIYRYLLEQYEDIVKDNSYICKYLDSLLECREILPLASYKEE